MRLATEQGDAVPIFVKGRLRVGFCVVARLFRTPEQRAPQNKGLGFALAEKRGNSMHPNRTTHRES